MLPCISILTTKPFAVAEIIVINSSKFLNRTVSGFGTVFLILNPLSKIFCLNGRWKNTYGNFNAYFWIWEYKIKKEKFAELEIKILLDSPWYSNKHLTIEIHLAFSLSAMSQIRSQSKHGCTDHCKQKSRIYEKTSVHITSLKRIEVIGLDLSMNIILRIHNNCIIFSLENIVPNWKDYIMNVPGPTWRDE